MYSLHLCTLSATILKPLETIQNKALRIILGCPMSTRIIAMQIELDIPPLVEYIKSSAIIYGVKVAKFQVNDVDNSTEDSISQSTPGVIRSLIQGTISFKHLEHPKVFRIISNGARKYNINLFGMN